MQAPQSYIQHSLVVCGRAREGLTDQASVHFLAETGQPAKGMYDALMYDTSSASSKK